MVALYLGLAVAIIALLWWIKSKPGLFSRIIEGFFDVLGDLL